MNKKAGRILMLCAGVTLMVASYAYFLVPNRIAPGGITGIATILHYLLGFPVGITAAVLNVPLFVLGFRHIGWKFSIKSFVAMMAVSLLIDIVPPYNLTGGDVLLGCAYGGALLGLGLGLVLLGGATTGGTDLLAQLIHKALPGLSMGKTIFAIDIFVVVTAGVVFDPIQALYSMAALLISTFVVDIILEGVNAAKAFFIISDATERIAERILSDLGRGATALKGTGMYSGNDRPVLLCVLGRDQVMRLKNIVKEEDPGAFVIVSDVREAMGEGFAPYGK